jgi:hypothetical protein
LSRAQTTKKLRVFENEYVRIPIPADWTVDSQSSEGGIVTLLKDNFRLSLGYNAAQSSGIVGGRFGEAFRVPWIADLDQASQCGFQLERVPQPATRDLMLINLYLPTDDEKTRAQCELDKDLTLRDSNGPYDNRRWFGGFFTADGGYFIDDAKACEEGMEKVYTLTSTAKTADQLPARNDRTLHDAVYGAIDIIRSIRYKKCPPVTRAFNP